MTKNFEAMLTETFGPPPRADIDAWRKRYPSALAWLNPQRISVLSQRRKRMQRIMILAATTAAAICVWLGLSHFEHERHRRFGICPNRGANPKGQDHHLEADAVRIFFHKDGKRTWVKTDEEHAYKAPGLYRTVK